MEWFSTLSQQETLEGCVEECAAGVAGAMGTSSPDLAVVFVSSLFRHRYRDLPRLLSEHLPARAVLGCSGGGTIGGGREVEHANALSVTVARLPGVRLQGFHLPPGDLPDLDGPPDAWHQRLGVPREPTPHFVLLADPFTADVQALAMGLDYAYPRSAKVGGLASDAREPGGNLLLLDGQGFDGGAVGVALGGDLDVDTVVAQGCRPIGRPMVITQAQGHYLVEVDRRPPVEVLVEMLEGLDPRDRALARHSLFLGLLMDPLQQQPSQGDFLIRNLLGVDPRTGIMAVGAELRPGQTAQFHLRDARTSAEDLERMLSRYSSLHGGLPPAGGLLFSCLGRGRYLYGEEDHDSRLFRALVGAVPLGGFFCNGEIGPVGGTTHLHGYTSCFALFRPPLAPPTV